MKTKRVNTLLGTYHISMLTVSDTILAIYGDPHLVQRSTHYVDQNGYKYRLWIFQVDGCRKIIDKRDGMVCG